MKFTPQQLKEFVSRYSSVLPEGATERIIVDNCGGLAYPLFGSSFSRLYSSSNDLVLPGDVNTDKLNTMESCLRNMRNYVDDAAQHARDYSFKLLYIKGNNETGRNLVDFFVHNTVPIYRFGVGRTSLTSAKTVGRFCDMIRSGHERFEERYDRIKELAEKLRSS